MAGVLSDCLGRMSKLSLKFFALCLLTVIVQLTASYSASAATLAYYRFEDGSTGTVATKLKDSTTNGLDGFVFFGGPTYQQNASPSQIAVTGQVNNFYLQLANIDATKFSYPFPFQTYANSTLEFWIDPNPETGWDFIWGTMDPGDTNRFHVYWSSAQGGSVCLAYREPGGLAHGLGCTPDGSVPASQWSFIAFVKTGNHYATYLNNQSTGNSTTLVGEVNDITPVLPTTTAWTLNGRLAINGCPSCDGGGLIDELRFSDQALAPKDFLVTQPFPIQIAIQPPALAPPTIHVRSSKIVRVTAFGSPTLATNLIDRTSIRFSGAPVALNGSGTPKCAFSDVNADGVMDLTCQFAASAITLPAGLRIATMSAKLRASAVLVGGSEEVNILP